MKKQMKRTLCVVLAVIMCFTLGVSVQAATTTGYVKSISVISKSTITIPADAKTKTATYKVTVKVSGKASKAFTAKSSNTAVATVKVSGSKIVVTAKKAGKAVITVTAKAKNNKGKKLSKKLTVTVKKAKPKEDDKDGKITKVTKKIYYFNAADPENPIGFEEHPIYFSSAYPDVPFVSDSFAVPFFLESYGYANPEQQYTVVKNGLIHTYQLPMGTSLTFNNNTKTMYFSDYTSTLVFSGDVILFNPMGPRAEKETPLYKMTEADHYYGGDALLLNFGYDAVPMLRSGDEILIPLQTFSDLFFSYQGQFLSYNGKDIYAIDNNLANDPSRKAYYDQYCDNEKVDMITPALAQVNYYEFCNALDIRYGLRAAHDIEDFDSYFARKGIKKRMLTTDIVSIEKAMQDLGPMLFEDFHSGAGMQSVFLKEPVKSDSQMSPAFINRQYQWKRISDKRLETLGTLGEDFSGYERRGDTVFITFDQFAMDLTMTSYYNPGYEPTANVQDTIELFAYALKHLQNEDKDVKNVVIDLANNGGGVVFACGYAMQAICGECNIYVQNPNTKALHQVVLDYDLNLDGVKDENDKSMLDLGLNVAVNISDSSFSSGNLLPNALDMLDKRILLIGQKSGGGGCSVGYLSSAVGSTFQFSSEHRFVTMKNGYIRDIDGGVAPDIVLGLNRMFDRNYIITIVDQYFANAS